MMAILRYLIFGQLGVFNVKNEMPSLDVLQAKHSNVLVFPINLEKPNKKGQVKFLKISIYKVLKYILIPSLSWLNNLE